MRFRIGVLATSLILLTSVGMGAAPPETTGRDGHIRIQIERWLADHQLPGIVVTVHQGHATLDGSVPNAWARREAFEYTRYIEGVTSVTCELAVWPRIEDAPIAREVERRIQHYAFYTVYEHVEVAVKDGRVTLTGHVMADTSVGAIADIAAHVNGVVHVINMLRTLPVSSTDDAIREAVAGRLYEDATFSSDASRTRRPIRIIVDHGRVMLTGVVDSEVARDAAARITRGMCGVISVENRLKTRPASS